MQQYQNYLNQQSQYSSPYLNGVYGQQMGYQQPQQQINPLLQPPVQQPQQPQMLPTYVVDDFSQILAKDVPMDKQGAFFIKKDGTEAEWRVWDASGEIKPTHFKAILGDKNSQMDKSMLDAEKLKIDLSDEATGAFMKRFDELSERLGELEDILSQPKTRGRKKENDRDE